MPDNDWRVRAACGTRDPEMFFPAASEHTVAGRVAYAEAKRVCANCPVISACLDYALDANLEHGVFGRMTPDERRELAHKTPRKTLESAL